MTRLLGTVILVALATTGCLSSGILFEASQPSLHRRTIEGVTGAVVDGDHVIIGLEVRREGLPRLEHLDVAIPLSDLDWARANIEDGNPVVPGVVFARPPKDALDKSTPLKKGKTIDIEPFDLASLEDVATVRDTLPPGLHVLLLRHSEKPGGPVRSIPAFLDTRVGHEPYGVVLADLPSVRTHKRAVLLLMPLAAPIDAVTFPLQLLVVALAGGC